jgi:hypothetical protein
MTNTNSKQHLQSLNANVKVRSQSWTLLAIYQNTRVCIFVQGIKTGQCTCDVTLRCVRVTIVAVEKQ